MSTPTGLALAAAILLAVLVASRPSPPAPSPGAGLVVPTPLPVHQVSNFQLLNPEASSPASPPTLAALLRAGHFEKTLARAATLTDPAEREHWTLAALRLAPPERLAAHALAQPPGPARQLLLDESLARWILIDPASAAAWMSRHLSDSDEFDRAAALLVQRTDSLHRPTATALALSEDLANPDLRHLALSHVVREWNETDPEATLRYVESASTLTLDQRLLLFTALTPPDSQQSHLP